VRPLFHRCVVEALGTLLLVAVGPGAVMVAARTHAFGQTGIALAFGLVVTIIVAACGSLSGAHVNPAVTIGLWSVGRFPTGEVAPYIVAQCVGAAIASIATGWLIGPFASFGATVPQVPIPQAFVIEAGYTAVLGFVIMALVTDERMPPSIIPFAVGATIFAGALVTGPLTGGSFNPARSLGPAIASHVWTAHWVYWLAPVSGSVAAMRFHTFLNRQAAR